MGSKAFDLSVSRWHRVAERIAQRVAEIETSATDALVRAAVDGWPGREGAEALDRAAKKAVEDLARAAGLLEFWAQVRARLAKENADSGVGLLMARREAAVKELRIVRKIVDGQGPAAVPLSALETYRPFQEQKAPVYRMRGGDEPKGAIGVRTLGEADLAALEKRAAELSALVSRLADEASDRNAARISMEVPAEVVEIAGL